MFLLAAYRIQSKRNVGLARHCLGRVRHGLVTYGYFAGRALAPLFALGLLSLATPKPRFIGVIKVWLANGLTLLPLLLFNRSHPGVVTKRLYEVSYIRSGVPWKEIAYEFVRRYLEEQSLTPLLLIGDYHPRHHVQGSGGAIFFATFVLAMFGLGLIIVGRWREPWLAFCLYGLAVSILPGAITTEPFHQRRYGVSSLSASAYDPGAGKVACARSIKAESYGTRRRSAQWRQMRSRRSCELDEPVAPNQTAVFRNASSDRRRSRRFLNLLSGE